MTGPGTSGSWRTSCASTLLLSPNALILPENLPEKFRPSRSPETSLLTPLETAERQQILQALEGTGWNQSRAAQRLGIDRKTLRTKIQRYGLKK